MTPRELRHADFIALNELQFNRLTELALFWHKYGPDPRSSEVLIAALLEEAGEEWGIVLADDVLFDLQLIVMNLDEVDAVITDLHRDMYRDMLNELRLLKGLPSLVI
jgi:hypothetical protein